MSDHAADAPAETSKSSGGGLKVGGIIAAIVLLQCALAYFLLPAAPTVAAATNHDAKAGHSVDHASTDGEHGAAHGPTAEQSETREVDLGRYTITAFDQSTNSTILIDFYLFGAVLEDPKPAGEHGEKEADGGHGGGHDGAPAASASEPEDTSKFGKLYKKQKHRIRDQVIVILRNSSPADLADPALGLIKRQILAKTNSLLGEPMLKEIVFSEFSVVQH